eukprot:COSAG01_NODE_12727_length_1693_cov_1.609159_1_plen_138_part_00
MSNDAPPLSDRKTIAGFERFGAVVIAKSQDFVVLPEGHSKQTHISAAEAAQPAAALPSGWSALRDPASGRTYYANQATSEVSWERPVVAFPAAVAAAAAPPTPVYYHAHQDASGRTYYHNPSTDETTWELPPGAVLK